MDANATNYDAQATLDNGSCTFPSPDDGTLDGNQSVVPDDGVTPEETEPNEQDNNAMAELLGSLGTVGGALLLGLVLMGLSWAIRRTAS